MRNASQSAMKLFRVPPGALYSSPRCSFVAPDGSFVYCSYTDVCWLRPGQTAVTLDHRSKIFAIDCCPTWESSKLMVSLGEDRNVWIWDLDKKAVIKGHSAHVEKGSENRKEIPTLACCWTMNQRVLSSDRRLLVEYCVASNTYKVHTDVVRNHKITLLSASPYDPETFAVGTEAGLVMVFNSKKMSLLFTLRGFDSPIFSLDWTQTSEETCEMEEEDLFDRYVEPDESEEFGVSYAGARSQGLSEANQPSNAQNELFDFVEACENLKEEILRPSSAGETGENPELADCRANRDNTPEYLPSESRSNSALGQENGENGCSTKTWLLCTSKEPSVFIWDVGTGQIVDKIKLPSGKSNFYVNSISARWIDGKTLVTNEPRGYLSVWRSNERQEGRVTFHLATDSHFSDVRGVVDLAANRKTCEFWAISAHQSISLLNISRNEQVLQLSTLPQRCMTMEASPCDPNLIAIGSLKRISLLNLLKVSEKQFFLSFLNQKVQALVNSLAWHPEKENLLAFSTKEGRVGVFDTNKPSLAPVLMQPFGGKDVYNVVWGQQADSKSYDLFCVTHGKLVVYPQGGTSRFRGSVVDGFENVTCVGVKKFLMGVGTYHGEVLVCDLSQNLKVLVREQVGQKLVSCFDWKDDVLAVSSFEHKIVLLDLKNREEVSRSTLEGHTGSVFSARWNQFGPPLVVSCSSDSTVRVWDSLTFTCLHSVLFESEVYVSLFHPTLPNTVIVGGKDFMITILDYTQEVDFSKAKTGAKPLMSAFQAARLDEEDAQTKIAKERKKNRRKKGAAVEEVESQVGQLTLEDPKPMEPAKPKSLQFNYTTIFCLTNRELNRDPLSTLQKMIRDRQNPDSPAQSRIRNDRLLSEDEELVNSVLNEELRNHRVSNTDSVAHLTLPLLNFQLKETILERIETKTLTETYLALAPFVSYVFWRECCEAFALQCVENGETLRSTAFFLLADKVSEAIDALLEGKHFPEAMAVAKKRRPLKQVTDRITEAWIKYLVDCGNFEGAAIVLVAANELSRALETLKMRKTATEELEKVIENLGGLLKEE